MSEELVILERKESYAVITLNQPKKLNALSPELLDQLWGKLDEVNNEKIVVITGSGRAFSAGADIKAFNQMDGESVRGYINSMSDLFLSLGNRPPIFIAHVNGHAIGGGAELMLSCDLVYISKQAKIGFPETKLGLIPGATGTVRLTKILGSLRAKEILTRGAMMLAEEAYELGLALHVVNEEQLPAYVQSIVQELSEKSAESLGATKSVVEASVHQHFADAIQHERNQFVECFNTEQSTQLRRAFEER